MGQVGIYDEKQVIERLIEGQPDAFRQLFNRYRNEVYTYSCKISKRKEYAEEIVQDVFVIVWQKREALNPEMPIAPYLYTITQNLSFNFLKKAANENRLKKEVFYRSQKDYRPEWETDYNDTLHLINEAITILPARQREIFSLSRDKLKSHDEISHSLGISKNTVKDQIFKALKFIRHHLSSKKAFSFVFPIALLCEDLYGWGFLMAN